MDKLKLIKEKDEYYLCTVNDWTNTYIASTNEIYKDYKISLKNCQEIENDYNLNELADKANGYLYFDSKKEYKSLAFDEGYHTGFQKALELFGNKKFSEKDMISAYNKGKKVKYSTNSEDIEEHEFIQSLQQTEWDVEIEMLTTPSQVFYAKDVPYTSPKLDKNGCLILKRKR
jgi:hypothetical protein